MKNHSLLRKNILILLLILPMLLCCTDGIKSSNSKKTEKKSIPYQKIEGGTQGTTYHITYQDKRDLGKEIELILHQFDISLTTYDPATIISRINNNDPEVVPDLLFLKVFEEAREIYQATDGAFDITIGPVVNVWGFGPGEKQEVDSAMIRELLQYVGMDKISLKDGKLIKESPEITLNVNAIAQGYSVDVVASYLNSRGIKNYLVEIGGELKCQGKNPRGTDWKIGVDRPVDGNMEAGSNIQVILALKTKSLATSGNYRKFFEKDGIKYAHSINPKTGYPVLGRLLSATILADECITADAYATSCMVMGLEKSIQLLEMHEELEGYLIYSDEKGAFRVFATPGMTNHIVK